MDFFKTIKEFLDGFSPSASPWGYQYDVIGVSSPLQQQARQIIKEMEARHEPLNIGAQVSKAVTKTASAHLVRQATKTVFEAKDAAVKVLTTPEAQAGAVAVTLTTGVVGLANSSKGSEGDQKQAEVQEKLTAERKTTSRLQTELNATNATLDQANGRNQLQDNYIKSLKEDNKALRTSNEALANELLKNKKA